MAPSPQTPGIVAGRLDAEALAANFADIAPRFSRARGLGGGGPLLFLLRRALRRPPARPRSTSRSSSARSPAAMPEAAARTILSPEHPRRHVRAGLPDRDALRGGLRARGGGGQAGGDRPAAALRDRRADGARRRSRSRGRRPTGKRVAVVGAGPAGLACAHRLAMLGHDGGADRRAGKGRRAQRVRDRGLQGGRGLRPGGGRLAARDRRHRGANTAGGSGAT